MSTAATSGFFVARGFPADIPLDRRFENASCCACFNYRSAKSERYGVKKFDASHSNVYRGWFPLQKGFLTSKEGIDLGPDVAYGPSVVRDDDPLREATPLPAG